MTAPTGAVTGSSAACVVIPIYRPGLLPFEKVALERCLAVLAAHDIFVIKPRSLVLTDLVAAYGLHRLESFDDEYFKGIGGYNRLMLSDDFYARFADYRYLLIHQLDAFVFEDQLQAWCDRGYDYLGAPWLPAPSAPQGAAAIYTAARRRLSRWIDRRDPAHGSTHGAQYMYAVGNGGFSLRRVARMREVLRSLASTAQRYRQAGQLFANEDIFFSVAANRFRRRVRVPDFREAAGFAWELQPALARSLNQGRLPFGCHAWNKLHRDDWRPIFAGLGHDLDRLL